MLILDEAGVERDMGWLIANFGPVVFQDKLPGPGFVVTKVQAQVGPCAIICRVLDPYGDPMVGVKMGWYWADADEAPGCNPVAGVPAGMLPDICDLPMGVTNAEGIWGGAMGGGAAYQPPAIDGHAVWVGHGINSALVWGLGWIRLTDHRHLNVEFRLVEDGGGGGECPVEQVLALVASAEELMVTVRAQAVAADAAMSGILAEIRGLMEEV